MTDSVVDVGNGKINMLNMKDRYTNNWREDFIFPTKNVLFINVYMLLCYPLQKINHYRNLII